MGITVTFSSYEEMVAFAKMLAGETSAPVKQDVKKEAPKQEPVKEDAPVQEDTPIMEDAPVEDEAPFYTLEDVRAKLTELSRSGKREAVKNILTAVGASNVTSVDPKKYVEVMQRAGKA